MLPLVLTILGFVLASLGQVCLNGRQNENVAVLLLAAAVVLTAVAFRRLSVDEGQQEQQPRSNWDRQGMLALLVASLPAWVAGCLLAVRWESLYTGLLLYAAGLSLVALVCALRERWRLPALSTLKDHWLELTLVGLVLALGLFLRVYRLDYYPPPGGISWNDEAQIGKDAYGVLHHGYRPWQFPFSVYATCVSFLLLGPTVLALRLAFVTLGFVTLIVFYLLAREVFRFPVALSATSLFAVSRWHIAFSRLALPSTPAMLLEVATFYLLLRGRRTGGMMNYVLAGLTMGLGLYSHASFRIVPLLVLLLFLGQAWSWWRARRGGDASRSRGTLSPWLSFLASAIVITVPLAAIVWREPHLAFGERFSSVMPVVSGSDGVAGADSVAERALRLLGFFNYQGEAWGAVNLPDLPMLDPVTGLFFVLGLGYYLFRFWRNRHLFLLSWFLITIIGGGLLTLDLRSHRFAGVMPVLFLFAGVFLEGAWATFRTAFGASRRNLFVVALVPMLALAGYANYHIFFHRQIHADSVRIEFTREISAVANYIASLGEGHYVYLFANYPYYSPGMDFAWMAREAPGERGIDLLDVIPSHGKEGDQDLVYIFVTPYNVEALAEVVRYFYPQARMETFQGEYDRYTFVAAHVAAEEIGGAQGLLGSYYSGYGTQDEPDVVRQEGQLSFDWTAEEPPLAFPFSAEWKGTLYAPEAGSYVLEMEPPGTCQIWIGESELEEKEEIRLVKGWHKLRVTCLGMEDGGSARLLWTAPRRQREVVAAEFLSPKGEVNGVLVSLFRGPDWAGEPVDQSIQPSLSLLRVPTAWQSAFVSGLEGEKYSLECRGEMKIGDEGSYGFNAVPRNGNATLWVDGIEVRATGGEVAAGGSGGVELGRGWHDLRLRYAYHGGEFSGVEVLWTPPGGEEEVIPPALMRPGEGVITWSASLAP
ncbi:MAG TPA: PA14 domain-containing protein [Anaerolineae bacterium]|nr:PA14 domain-containing protein [Anaerolineae bacterium]